MQFITGSQLGIHKVIGTWNTWGGNTGMYKGVGRGSSGDQLDGVGLTRQVWVAVR